MKHRRSSCLTILGILLCISGVAVAADVPIRNWSAPATWSPQASTGGGRTALADLSNMLPFTAITPCRVIDTRAGSGFPAGYGGPSMLGASNQRWFAIAGQCGIPAGAQAVSFNFTVWNTTTTGDLRVFPGPTIPNVSTLNWGAGIVALANAAVVPLSGVGSITVQIDGPGTVDIFVDVNGYYASAPSGTGYLNISTSGSYAAALYTTGGNDSLHTQCLGPTSCWAIHAVADPAGSGYSGYFQGAKGLYSSVSLANAFAVEGYSSTGSGARFTTGLTNGQIGGVVGVSGGASVLDNFWGAAGVRGIGSNFGTLGISTNLGVGGFRVDGTGAYQSGSYLGYTPTIGLFTIGTTAASGVKNFIEPHPTDPTKAIRYTSLEGPEAGTYFRGRGGFEGRSAVIDVPEDFRLVTDADGLSIQVTPIGELASVAVVSIDTDRIVLKSSRDVQFFYTVNGVRRSFKDMGPIVDNQTFFVPDSPQARMPLAFSDEQRRSLIANGTYNADGTANMNTAERVGWTRVWQERDERARANAVKAAAEQTIPHHD